MALNITFDGYAYDNSGSIDNGTIRYQGLFYPNSTASSPTAWNTVRVVEASGYYNINLGSADWLGQEGTALNGARVVIVFWKGGADRLADCGIITEWGAFEVSLDGRAFYSYNTQVKANILPTLNWANNLPAHSYVNTSYSFINSSTDIHSWDFNGVTMYHWYTRYGQIINNTNVVTETDYEWGDGASDLALTGASNASHTWDTAGNYNITITIRDACGDEVSETISNEFYWAAPQPNIVRCDAGGNPLSNTIETPDTSIYFKYTGTNPDNTIVAIDWHIDDTGDYGDTDTSISTGDTSEIIAHTEGLGTSWDSHPATSGAFTNPGTHRVTVVITWYDGFQNQTVTYHEDFIQRKYDRPPVPNIVCNEATSNLVSTPSTPVTFSYTGTDPEDRITTIDWTINDSGVYGNTDSIVNDKLKTDTISHTNGEGASWCGNLYTAGAFTNPGSHAVSIDVNWHDGWDENSISYSETITQGKFTGPVIGFNQVPANAKIGSEVSFENTSTSASRVGLGLPDCEKYTWTWLDSGVSTVVSDVDASYVFNKNPESVTCSVKLCADWSDGWETKTSCKEKDVVFKTTVTVTPEDCYYVLDVTGTSTDGTATAYGWTISSGTSVSGSFDEVWVSPIADDQQQKTLCFSALGWFKIEGAVYGGGSPTSDFQMLYIDETCEGYGEVTTVAVCEPDIETKYVDVVKPDIAAGEIGPPDTSIDIVPTPVPGMSPAPVTTTGPPSIKISQPNTPFPQPKDIE